MAWLCSPERITDRLAEQLAVVQKAFLKRVPSVARASRFGVFSAGFPYAPKSGLWSSVTNKTTLRFAAWARPRLRQSKKIKDVKVFIVLIY